MASLTPTAEAQQGTGGMGMGMGYGMGTGAASPWNYSQSPQDVVAESMWARSNALALFSQSYGADKKSEYEEAIGLLRNWSDSDEDILSQETARIQVDGLAYAYFEKFKRGKSEGNMGDDSIQLQSLSSKIENLDRKISEAVEDFKRCSSQFNEGCRYVDLVSRVRKQICQLENLRKVPEARMPACRIPHRLRRADLFPVVTCSPMILGAVLRNKIKPIRIPKSDLCPRAMADLQSGINPKSDLQWAYLSMEEPCDGQNMMDFSLAMSEFALALQKKESAETQRKQDEFIMDLFSVSKALAGTSPGLNGLAQLVSENIRSYAYCSPERAYMEGMADEIEDSIRSNQGCRTCGQNPSPADRLVSVARSIRDKAQKPKSTVDLVSRKMEGLLNIAFMDSIFQGQPWWGIEDLSSEEKRQLEEANRRYFAVSKNADYETMNAESQRWYSVIEKINKRIQRERIEGTFDSEYFRRLFEISKKELPEDLKLDVRFEGFSWDSESDSENRSYSSFGMGAVSTPVVKWTVFYTDPRTGRSLAAPGRFRFSGFNMGLANSPGR